jgi:RluA family pseudouridine synthase
MKFSSEVPRAAKSLCVIDYLTARFTYHERLEWMQMIAEGRVTCGGAVCSSETILSGGMTVTYEPADFDEPPANLDYTVIYEDDWILGINKPGNLLVHRAGKAFCNNLMYQLRHVHNPLYPTANAVSRLDRETSGVIVAAKDAETLKAMNSLFAQGKIEKTYLAIVRGVPSPLCGEIDLAIEKVEDCSRPIRFRTVSAMSPKAKQAVTDYTVLNEIGGNCSLVKIHPRTGRTHQIRVHMSAIGCPVAWDRVYGTAEDQCRPQYGETGKGIAMSRQALHCLSLKFDHVRTHKECEIKAPVPHDMERIISGW